MGKCSKLNPDSERPVIFVFCRPFYIKDFTKALAPLEDYYSFHLLTDGRSKGVGDTRKRFYSALASGEKQGELTPEECDDVIARCRLLRNLPRQQAEKLVNAMTVTLAEELDRVSPAGVLCQMVDEYITHILSLLAKIRGIRFAGYCYSYFPDHVQFTDSAYGTPFDFREPGDEEVNAVLALISQRAFRQNYQQVDDYTWPRHLKALARYRLKMAVFSLLRRLNADRWNCHFAMTPYIMERRHLRDFPHPNFFHGNWKAELEILKVQNPTRPVIYIPLGYFPESTIDYWIPDKRALRYEEITLETLKILSRDFLVVVKEHLHMMGGRKAEFLKSLRQIPGVISVRPTELSNDVLAVSDAVLLGAGSIGVEASVRGKPVFSYCETSYWFPSSGAFPLRLGEVEAWPDQIQAGLLKHRPFTEGEAREFIRACLKSTGHVRPGGKKIPLVDIDDFRQAIGDLITGGISQSPKIQAPS